MTSGNHIWDKREALAYIIGAEPRLIRPRQLPRRASPAMRQHTSREPRLLMAVLVVS